MEKAKKEKQQRQLKLGFKTIIDLKPSLTSISQDNYSHLLSKLYPQITQLNSLRILTVLEITYLLEVYLEIIERHNNFLLNEFKIGIIGGGITTRLIINSILPLSKDGLELKNITISTRQTEHFKTYVQNFGMRVHFDNELTAKQADLLIIATPATLDNWIIADLKDILEEKARASEKNSQGNIYSSALIGKIGEQKGKNSSLNRSETRKNTRLKRTGDIKQRIYPFKPLVYILTSDFSQEKCKKLFSFPVLTPSIRAKDIPTIKESLQLFTSQSPDTLQSHQKILAWWLLKDTISQKLEIGNTQNVKDTMSVHFELSGQRYLRTPFNDILNALSFVIDGSIQPASINSSVSNTMSVYEHIRDRRREEAIAQVMEVVTSHGEIDQNLFTKIRKWVMAYNNFIA